MKRNVLITIVVVLALLLLCEIGLLVYKNTDAESQLSESTNNSAVGTEGSEPVTDAPTETVNTEATTETTSEPTETMDKDELPMIPAVTTMPATGKTEDQTTTKPSTETADHQNENQDNQNQNDQDDQGQEDQNGGNRDDNELPRVPGN